MRKHTRALSDPWETLDRWVGQTTDVETWSQENEEGKESKICDRLQSSRGFHEVATQEGTAKRVREYDLMRGELSHFGAVQGMRDWVAAS